MRHYKHCQDCGKELKDYYANRCFDCWNIYKSGKNHPFWGKKRPEISGLNSPNYIANLIRIYPIEFNDYLKNSIRKRDNYICNKCGVNESKLPRKLSIHHIDYNKNNCLEENLICV